MEATVVGVVHADDAVRRGLGERLEGEQGIVLAALAPRAADLQLPATGPRVVVAGGAALEDPDLARCGLPIVVAASGRIAEARAALALGAADLVGWPRDANELPGAVRRAASTHGGAADAARGRVLAVLGARGGLGTTTLAVWLATGLRAHALIELDPAGTLGSYGTGTADATLRALAEGTGAEHVRRCLRDVGLGVPVAFGEPGATEPGAVALRAIVASLRSLGGWSVVDLGRADGMRAGLLREVDARILLACDEVAPIRAATARRLTGIPWARRTLARRSGVHRSDVADALGAAPLATLAHDPAVARAADLGRLAPAPAGIATILAQLDPAAAPAGSASPAGALAKMRARIGALR